MSLMTSLMMKILDLGSPPVREFIHVLNYPLIVLVNCCVKLSSNKFVVSVEYFPFTAQKVL